MADGSEPRAVPGLPFPAAEGTELRPIEPADHGFPAERWNRRDVWLPTNTHGPLATDDVAGVVDSDVSVNFPICADGDPIGSAWLFDVDGVHGRAELGYWVDADHRGEGHATAAARLLVEYGVNEKRLRKLFVRVFEGNDVSERVPRKVGFEQGGTLRDHYYVDGEWLDASLWGYLADQ